MENLFSQNPLNFVQNISNFTLNNRPYLILKSTSEVIIININDNTLEFLWQSEHYDFSSPSQFYVF